MTIKEKIMGDVVDRLLTKFQRLQLLIYGRDILRFDSLSVGTATLSLYLQFS